MALFPTEALLCLLAVTIAAGLYWRRKNVLLPPGPKGTLLFGNTFDVPKEQEWLAYHRWSRQYDSDVIYLNLAGTPVIVVNSAKAAHDLFEKRSSTYSDRSRMVMINELIGCNWHFVFMAYGENWRERRRIFHQHFHPNAVLAYRPRMRKGAKELLRRLLDTPDDYMEHLRHMAGSLILGSVYGIEVQAKNDPYIATAERALAAMAAAGNAGSYLVESIPILKNVPDWFPGAGFKLQAAEWRKSATAMVEVPFNAVKKAIADGTAVSSVISSLLADLDGDSDNAAREKVYSGVAAAAYTGGSDTTVSAVGTFFLAMLLYPEVQRRAQEEVDRVIGQGRLPDFSDEPSLPYVSAIVKEVLRWQPVTPLAVPHRLTADDLYNGYHLPAGAIVVGNAWAILHDDRVFPDPERFSPERFLTPDGQLNPKAPDVDAAFGFGRRICPGRHLANASIWLAIASVLATLTLEKAVDEQGNVNEPRPEYTTGLVSYPIPFKCTFKPRSSAAVALIQSELHFD